MSAARFGIVSIADTTEQKMSIHDKHKQWIMARGLDASLAEKMGIETVQRDGAMWLAIPYMEGGERVNAKYRLTSKKDHRMDTGAALSLYNADVLRDPKVQSGQAPVIITEGEWDALAAIQVGFPHVVSVPNGAPATETADLDNAKRYDWIDRHSADLKSVATFIIAADDDQAGWNLRADLVALLGADRCKFVQMPFPCKDLNEVLQEYGPERLVECITTAKPIPIQGLYTIDDFPEKGEVRSYSVGVKPLVDMISIVPGTLTIVTGYSNMGKSTLLNVIIGHAIRWHFPVCVASFETDVKPILVNGLRCAIMGCANTDLRGSKVDEDMEMDLDQFLDLCRVAVTRHGVKMIVLDPWNEIEHKRRNGESETDYIGRAIRAVKRFAKQYDVAFWIIAHPTKPNMDNKNKIPGLYDISGSAHWANKADYGLTYHRPNPDENRAEIRVNKVRMGLPGQKGAVFVKFNFPTAEFQKLEAA
jgi:twinkle protein